MKELDVEVHLGKEIDSVEKFGDAPVNNCEPVLFRA